MAFAELQCQNVHHSGTSLGTNVYSICRNTKCRLARYIGQHMLYNSSLHAFQWNPFSGLYSIIALTKTKKMGFIRSKEDADEIVTSDVSSNEIDQGSLHYTAEGGENSNRLTIQEASGAPVEQHSPLGYSVGPVTVVFLNLSMMIGTGVFSTRMHLLASFMPRSILTNGILSICHS